MAKTTCKPAPTHQAAARAAKQPASVTRQELPPAELVQVECPLRDFPPHCYVTPHVEVQLDAAQAATLRRLVEGLDVAGARLANNRRVTTGPDAVRYLLDRLADKPAAQPEG